MLIKKHLDNEKNGVNGSKNKIFSTDSDEEDATNENDKIASNEATKNRSNNKTPIKTDGIKNGSPRLQRDVSN